MSTSQASQKSSNIFKQLNVVDDAIGAVTRMNEKYPAPSASIMLWLKPESVPQGSLLCSPMVHGLSLNELEPYLTGEITLLLSAEPLVQSSSFLGHSIR